MTGPAAGAEVRLCRSVADIGEAAWNELVTGGAELEHSREFLEYLEEIDGANRLYSVASEAGNVVAVSQAAMTSDRTVWLSRPSEMLASLEQLRIEPWDLTAVSSLREQLGLSATPASAHPGLQADYEERLYPSVVVRNLWDCLPLARPGWDQDPASSFRILLPAIEEFARDNGARSVTCLNVAEDDEAVHECLRARGYAGGLYCAIAEIDLRHASTFGDYLARFSGDTRRGHLRDMRLFRDAGLTLAELDPEKFLAVVVEQEAQNWARYGDPVGFEYLWNLRRPLVQHLGSRARLLGAVTRTGEVIASGIHLLGRDVYHCFTFGADYAQTKLAGCYQAVTFYGPVEAALSTGRSRVNLGFEAYQGKVFRGARLRPMYAYVLPLDGGAAEFTSRLLAFVSEQTAAHLAALIRPRLRQPAGARAVLAAAAAACAPGPRLAIGR